MFWQTYVGASPESRAEGWRWYTDARGVVLLMAVEFNRPPSVVAGVIAALSPRQQWLRNLRVAALVLDGKRGYGLSDGRRKAKRIIGGIPPLEVLGGPKTRAFYRALMGDDNAVVIDIWMLRCVGWPRDACTVNQYAAFEMQLSFEASVLQVPPAVMQAVVWCETRKGGE